MDTAKSTLYERAGGPEWLILQGSIYPYWKVKSGKELRL